MSRTSRLDSGNRVGMKRKELEPAKPRTEEEDLPLPEWRRDRTKISKISMGSVRAGSTRSHNDGSYPDFPEAALLVKNGDAGEIVQVGAIPSQTHQSISLSLPNVLWSVA